VPGGGAAAPSSSALRLEGCLPAAAEAVIPCGRAERGVLPSVRQSRPLCLVEVAQWRRQLCGARVCAMHTITDHLVIRPLGGADRDALAEAFTHLSEDTRRRRFGALARRLGERELDQFTDVDHHRHEGLAAVVRGRIVGVAHYIALPGDNATAEIAVAVDDEWQRRGIGGRLIRGLVRRAREEGITRLLAYVGADNRPVLDWIARAGGIAEARDGDALVFTIPLDGSTDTRRAA
jgi:GNAT superfamily N-acetyltransferase